MPSVGELAGRIRDISSNLPVDLVDQGEALLSESQVALTGVMSEGSECTSVIEALSNAVERARAAGEQLRAAQQHCADYLGSIGAGEGVVMSGKAGHAPPVTKREKAPHPIDEYYDAIFEAATAQDRYFPYSKKLGLVARVGTDEVVIADPDVDAYKFSVCRALLNGKYVLTFSVCNVIDGQRHPLLYPGRLMERAVALFEGNGTVDKVMGCWLAPPAHSDNYRDYAKGLQRLAEGRVPTAADRAQAASGTWTGRQFDRLGYSVVRDVIGDTYGNIWAFFGRQ